MSLSKTVLSSVTLPPASLVLKTLGASAGVIVLAEHFARIKNYNARPSVAITWTAEKSMALFKKLGTQLAILSSFYKYLQLDEFGQTLVEIAGPSFNLVASPFYMVQGYVTQLETYKNHRSSILAGTGTIVVVSALWFRYPLWYKYVLDNVPALPKFFK